MEMAMKYPIRKKAKRSEDKAWKEYGIGVPHVEERPGWSKTGLGMEMEYRIRNRAKQFKRAWRQMVVNTRSYRRVKLFTDRAWDGNGNEIPNPKDSQAVRREGLGEKW
jgi:hypothetical protein